jgi:hypothetical protein
MAAGRPQPYVEVAHLDARSYALKRQTQIWNSRFAFAYPALALNNRREVGLIVGVGGGDREAHASVGFLGDRLVFPLSASDTSPTRYGDFLTVRTASPDESLFSAFGYGTTTAGGNDLHYALFGRYCEVNPLAPTCAIE